MEVSNPWRYPKSSKSLDHDLVLKQPWQPGDSPIFGNHSAPPESPMGSHMVLTNVESTSRV